jgi:hypothetical protein
VGDIELFNLARFGTRRSNFTMFRRCLDVPLVVGELSLDGTFELADDNAETVLRFASPRSCGTRSVS